MSEKTEFKYPFQNYRLSVEERVADLISRLSIEEKISQLFNMATEIKRLGIPHYDWRNEALQGVAFVEPSTIFPQAIALAATFNEQLVNNVADCISTEARARHHEYIRRHIRSRWTGLTFSTPNINIFRDPRWGRGQETFGEDPYLTARMGVAFVKGLQGNDSRYLKTSAEPKHFAVHSGPEKIRHQINNIVSKKDLFETYLPAFEACIKEGNAEGIMSAYNRLYGKACSADDFLLEEILRKRFGFNGYVISDGGAIRDIHKYHNLASNYGEAGALALNAGCDILNPFNLATSAKVKRYRRYLLKSFNEGNFTEKTLDLALTRSFTARFKLGMFDPENEVPYSKISYSKINSIEHRKLALEAAKESIVLLKNENKVLPLTDDISSIAVIGPLADSPKSLYYPPYYPDTPECITVLDGIKSYIRKRDFDIEITYSKGCDLDSEIENFSNTLELAEKSDIIILALGLTGTLEGEEGYILTKERGDRNDLRLPEPQIRLLKEITKLDKPVILISFTGSAIALNYAQEHISSIIQAWYPGVEGGNALAEIIFGDYSPAGRLPITFYKSVKDLPDYTDYSMKNRTYRYFKGNPLYYFGFGLSYTQFEYKNLNLSSNKILENEKLEINLEIKNVGNMRGDDVVQLYLNHHDVPYELPVYELKRFKRISLEVDKMSQVNFTLNYEDFTNINENGNKVLSPGRKGLIVTSCSPGFKTDNTLHSTINIK